MVEGSKYRLRWLGASHTRIHVTGQKKMNIICTHKIFLLSMPLRNFFPKCITGLVISSNSYSVLIQQSDSCRDDLID